VDIVTDLDTNHNGVIDYPEFLRLVEAHPPKKIILGFSMLDKEGNGQITPEEFKATMEVMGMPLTDAQVEEGIKKADAISPDPI
jgi:Ca2+-binding EF-hand superfamily protein